MKFTLSWLKEHLDTTAGVDEISETLTRIGLEVEQVVNPAAALDGFITVSYTHLYQLDMEMSFATQDDVFAVMEKPMGSIFNEFGEGKKVDQAPFQRIAFKDAMLKYGSDKPDLRNPLIIQDATAFFNNSGFGVYDGKRCV